MDDRNEFDLTCDCGIRIGARSERQLLEETVRHADAAHGVNLSLEQARHLLRHEEDGDDAGSENRPRAF